MMKHLLTAVFAIVAVGGVFARNANTKLVDRYGIHPESGLCQVGTLESGCNNLGTTRCIVTFPDSQTAPAFLNGPTTCANALFKTP